MSIVRAAARIALVQAIKGNTFVQSNVFDSLISGISFSADGGVSTEQTAPFIGVYSDASEAMLSATSGSLHANGQTTFVLEFGIAGPMFTPASEDSGEETIEAIGVRDTDHEMELALDMIARQMIDTILDPKNAWSGIFRDLFLGFDKLERSRVGNDEHGVRLAGQQMRITGVLAEDPVKGETIDADSALGRLFSLIAESSDADLISASDKLQALIDGAVPDWEFLLRASGMTPTLGEALGPAPYVNGDPDQIMEEAEILTPEGGNQVLQHDD